jgi:hypothetical protein
MPSTVSVIDWNSRPLLWELGLIRDMYDWLGAYGLLSILIIGRMASEIYLSFPLTNIKNPLASLAFPFLYL